MSIESAIHLPELPDRILDRSCLRYYLLEIIEIQLRCPIRPRLFRLRMALDKQCMHADRGRGFGELQCSVGSASGLFARTWELGGVRHIEADWWRAELGKGGAIELHHVCDTNEVVDEAVVPEEGASFGEHEVFAPGFGRFADRADHFAG